MTVEPTSPWSGLVEQRQMLVRILKRRCADRSMAEDLAHDTLIRAARYRPSGLEPTRLAGWLKRIAHNVLNDHIRREHRGPRPEAGSEAILLEVEGREPAPGDDRWHGERYESGEASLCREEALRHAYSGLRRLSDRDRHVIAQACVDVVRAADAGIPRGTRKARLFRARRRLRGEVERSVRLSLHELPARAGGRA